MAQRRPAHHSLYEPGSETAYLPEPSPAFGGAQRRRSRVRSGPTLKGGQGKGAHTPREKRAARAAEPEFSDRNSSRVGSDTHETDARLAMAWLEAPSDFVQADTNFESKWEVDWDEAFNEAAHRVAASSQESHEEYVAESEDGEYLPEEPVPAQIPFNPNVPRKRASLDSTSSSVGKESSTSSSGASAGVAKQSFSLWLVGATLCSHFALQRIPFLRNIPFIIYFHFGDQPTIAVLITACISLSIGLLLAVNRATALRLAHSLNPTRETTAVYYALAATYIIPQWIIPRFFMALHYICHHVPIVGALVVFGFLVFLLFVLSFTAVSAIGIYSWDVTVTLHTAVKRWLGYDVSDKKRLSRRTSPSSFQWAEKKRGGRGVRVRTSYGDFEDIKRSPYGSTYAQQQRSLRRYASMADFDRKDGPSYVGY
ncbi:hypothetical protein BC830DRAFT_1088352 [Chytriomyces sp. MP71]|nr:hypothetical protein BC830DRAFT_1088352 [Chytriomyces sp. MP71]